MKLIEMKRRKKQNHKLFACFGIMIFFLNAINALNLQKLRANRDRNFKDN